MTFTQRTLWLVLTASLAGTAFGQSEPYYIPNTLPVSPEAGAPQAGGNYGGTPMPPAAAAPTPAQPSQPMPSTTAASSSSSSEAIYTYGQGGTQGLGVGIGMKVNPSWVIRAEVNGLNLNRDFTKGSNTYAGKGKLRSEGVYADYYPMENSPLRVTGGLMFNQSKLTGDATLSGSSVVYNGNTYVVGAGETVTATVKAPSILPYLGVGYGHDEADKQGLKFHADLGFAFGSKPSASITLPSSLSGNATADADRRAEEKKLEDSFKTTPFVGKVQPVAEVGVGYTW
jgi:hypothetical protein